MKLMELIVSQHNTTTTSYNIKHLHFRVNDEVHPTSQMQISSATAAVTSNSIYNVTKRIQTYEYKQFYLLLLPEALENAFCLPIVINTAK